MNREGAKPRRELDILHQVQRKLETDKNNTYLLKVICCVPGIHTLKTSRLRAFAIQNIFNQPTIEHKGSTL